MGAHDDQLAGPQRPGDFIWPFEQATQSADERSDRRDVRPTDEAHRSPGRCVNASAVKMGVRA